MKLKGITDGGLLQYNALVHYYFGEDLHGEELLEAWAKLRFALAFEDKITFV